MFVDLEPNLIAIPPVRLTYKVHVYVHLNYEDDDDPFGPQVEYISHFVEHKDDALKVLNELHDLYSYILDKRTALKVTHEEFRSDLLDVVAREDGQLFIRGIAITYYDEYGRNCRVDVEEE